jgi:inosine-uridine nucleoside N-ribohydrolase
MTNEQPSFPIKPENRNIPTIPPQGQRLRVIIDSDAKNEIDDQWAIALAILSPERFEIEGFVGANFDNARGGTGSVQASVAEIETVLEKAGMAGRWPVVPGSDPLRYQFEPSDSEGVDFIIDTAKTAAPEKPLWVVGLGAATDMASALLKAPEIVNRVVAFWHLRTRWPETCYNFNVIGDVRAARLLFHTPVPFVLFDTGTYLRCPMAESAQFVAPYGELGRYLHGYRYKSEWYASPRKGFFDLGDIAALVDPELAAWDVTPCPEVGWDLRYRFTDKLGSIQRCYHVDRDRTFALLYEKLRTYQGAQQEGAAS